tara:strand:- start:1283 stop:1525 length:243 start_codon:yes stop_codon:yes gene_type:complete
MNMKSPQTPAKRAVAARSGFHGTCSCLPNAMYIIPTEAAAVTAPRVDAHCQPARIDSPNIRVWKMIVVAGRAAARPPLAR